MFDQFIKKRQETQLIVVRDETAVAKERKASRASKAQTTAPLSQLAAREGAAAPGATSASGGSFEKSSLYCGSSGGGELSSK